ncbi:PAS domain S-box protein [Chryseobacterium shandongense]|uniref:histidine kinase n=1 Tax=Chryseobacterium shandongense TaxID=1493872 RepID=A0A3G6QZD4_9FLAO|nr:PAS domain S-box protein [Chryseobacterium shandongense]AZA57888.1 PAS domain S-box protein [Chryseobacterium shandongense]AZA86128.1 PAS domain S-box protein [Chryseobacterium shandongense]AZA94539.1 PAS domain S-box protein [Chryseobacterium shandongense]
MKDSVPPLNFEQLAHIFSFINTATAVHVGEDARIEFANQAMLSIWGRGPEVIGKGLEEALPELSGQPFIEMFARVWREGITISGNDTPADILVDGIISTYYFDFEYRAVKDQNGDVIAILHTATDVTERYLNRRELEEASQNKQLLIREQSLNEQLAAANEELSAVNEELEASREELSRMNAELEQLVEDRVKALVESEERFRSMADNTDVLIAVRDHTGKLIYFNKAWTQLSGRTAGQLLDMGWYDLIYPLDKQKFLNIHQQAFAQRVSYSAEMRLLGADGSYHWLLKKGTPRFLSDGSFAGYISSCVDITPMKLGEQQLQDMNEELAASNEEFAALNEELATTNEELAESNEELLLSEARFRNLIRQAPVAICVIRAEDLVVTEVNDGYLELVGKSREHLEMRSIWEGVAEAAEVYAPIMKQVIETGTAFHGVEHELILNRNGVGQIMFIDFVYEPVKDLKGSVTSIMVVGNDVTDKVMARRQIEDIEERNRLAIEASEIGTYEFRYAEQSVIGSKRFDEIFGVTSPVSRAEVLTSFHPLDAHLSDEAHAIARKTGKLFYEARIVLANNAVKWVRLQGNVHYDRDGNVKKLLGTVMDITALKQIQQQKDDFISIASHELKTPLTSLKASLQLLERMKANPTALLPRLIEQSNKSMEKISELVEELLNVTRINEGKVMLNKKKFNFAHMVDECCSHVIHLGTHELLVEGEKNLEITADENRIQQVVINFINNAIKYAPKSRQIFLTIEKDIYSVKVSVKDNGPGIPAEKLPYLFERYYRVDPNGIQASGLGLGLYISADIIERHGGKIGVDSEEGKGSTFWFTLPDEI